MASGGKGAPSHVAGELFKMMAGVDMVHVPYRGEALALPDLISGQVQVYFAVMPASLGYIRAGKLRALAVTSATRQEALPDASTVGEFLPGYEARGTRVHWRSPRRVGRVPHTPQRRPPNVRFPSSSVRISAAQGIDVRCQI
jgi:tripartite-type tricarboxylate transporter receptor subunit TctC